MAFSYTSLFLPLLYYSLALVVFLALFVVVVCLVEDRFLSVASPPTIPLLREPAGARHFSLRTRLAYYTDCENLYREAYENYSKQGKAVVVPGVGFRKEVILPSKSLKWALTQPESRLDVVSAFVELNQPEYSIGHEPFVDSWQSDLVRTEVNRRLEEVGVMLEDELTHVIDSQFGNDTKGWKKIDLWAVMNRVIVQATGSFIVGRPLCRNKDYNRVAMEITNSFVMNGGIVGQVPKFMRPLVGVFLNRGTQQRLNKLEGYVAALWDERRRIYKAARAGEPVEEPADQIQMMVAYAEKHRPEELENYKLITRRIAVANLSSMFTTAFQVINLLLDIVSSDAEFNTIETLREEADQVLKSDGEKSVWTKANAAQLMKADSAARETMRLHSFMNRSVVRTVAVDDFYTQDGEYLPKGTTVSFLGQPVQTDGDNVENPLKYDPFRHSREREADESKKATRTLVTASPDYYAFGHGKHACPGRFLIDFEFKMIMTQLVKKYDIRFPDDYAGKRPPNKWVAEALLPPMNARIMVRRREEA